HALLAAPSAAALITAQFPEDDLRLFKPHAARFACSCSEERVENALRMVGRDEVEDILAEQGEVTVTCEFCNRRYAYAPAAARALFAPDGRAGSGASELRHCRMRLYVPEHFVPRARSAIIRLMHAPPFATLITPHASEP